MSYFLFVFSFYCHPEEPFSLMVKSCRFLRVVTSCQGALAGGFVPFLHCKVEQKKTDGSMFFRRRKVFESFL